jgi:hypothetical protein
VSTVNLTPTSVDAESPESRVLGVTAGPQIEQGHGMSTVVPGDGLSMFPLSSTARDLIVVDGLPWATQE